MTSEREVLLAICETPGWTPPDSSSAHRAVEELIERGWIQQVAGGYEACPRALVEYPEFHSDPLIAAPKPKRQIPVQFPVPRMRVRGGQSVSCHLALGAALGGRIEIAGLNPEGDVYDVDVLVTVSSPEQKGESTP